eukprot:scaffold513_cov169-Amphora_coffeaeformis.AAC.2
MIASFATLPIYASVPMSCHSIIGRKETSNQLMHRMHYFFSSLEERKGSVLFNAQRWGNSCDPTMKVVAYFSGINQKRGCNSRGDMCPNSTVHPSLSSRGLAVLLWDLQGLYHDVNDETQLVGVTRVTPYVGHLHDVI